ncbi:uncharacterized protein ColSpa_00527 [Colletotrichum spaethianum]|uniref:BZIP transcription factor n=1 Tax=Colletotrichum spaethianum TaxID=700344 RepID=A0AA37L1Q2_9PEZI|nr:uncharacterized protein ColSpa_00527 [Colletotrichum spaethianum]GKT40346.1 hypothetical protein ColSpa_00527 [Colletotrichum spaethianum]
MASSGQNDSPTPASGDPPAKIPSEKELARKIRKRELDRRAQRQARERTRNRIAELEAQVKELRKDDSTRLSACMEQLAATTRERDRLLDTFKSIEQTIRDHVLPSRPTPAAQKLSPPAPPRSLPSSQDTMLTGLPAHSYEAPIGLLPQIPSIVDANAFYGSGCDNGHGVIGTAPNGVSASSVHAPSVHAPSSTSDSQDLVEELEDDDRDENHDDPNVIVPPPESPCDCVTVRTPAGPALPRVNVWRAVNQVLAKKCRISREAHVTEDANDEDIPVRALLEGWDAVATSRPLSKLWKKLRRVDKLCFQTCPPTERLAILRTMHLLLQYHSDPTPERHSKLPKWYLKRPGLRERFVFGQHHYCNNQFWELFGPNFHMLWPFEFRDAYKKSVVTGKYQISSMFEERIMDINAWTMGHQFFDRFPELIADIPTFQSIGQSLTPAVTSPPMSQQASLSQLKEREEHLLLEQAAEKQSSQDVIDCTQAMQVFPPGLYSMAPSEFMNEFTSHGFDANGASYGPLPGYF